MAVTVRSVRRLASCRRAREDPANMREARHVGRVCGAPGVTGARRISASAGFAVQGLSFAAVIAQVTAFRDKYDFAESQLTLTLAAVPIIAGVGSVLAGVFAPRFGSAWVLRPPPWVRRCWPPHRVGRPGLGLLLRRRALRPHGRCRRRVDEHAGHRGAATVRPQHPGLLPRLVERRRHRRGGERDLGRRPRRDAGPVPGRGGRAGGAWSRWWAAPGC